MFSHVDHQWNENILRYQSDINKNVEQQMLARMLIKRNPFTLLLEMNKSSYDSR